MIRQSSPQTSIRSSCTSIPDCDDAKKRGGGPRQANQPSSDFDIKSRKIKSIESRLKQDRLITMKSDGKPMVDSGAEMAAVNKYYTTERRNK
jgi:hypothetical protein